MYLASWSFFLPVTCTRYSDKVLLHDIEVLTLYHGRYTTGRRSSRVPQLKCTGGTAGCSAFIPEVVQCYNRGTDGAEVQWECKTDMDNAFRFGEISVTCEGYDYPDDPYVLKGSCGLEYSIDLTKEGYARGYQSHDSHRWSDGKHSYIGTVLMFIVICAILYFVYSQFLSGTQRAGDAPPPYSADPPPPGFRPEYAPPPSGGYSSQYGSSGYGSSGYGSSGYGFQSANMGSGTFSQETGTGGGGFWSGAATGGILGYLLGSSSSRQCYHQPYPDPAHSWGSSGFGSSSHWGSSGWGSNHGSSSSGSSSSGTRTASGFGGTKRR